MERRKEQRDGKGLKIHFSSKVMDSRENNENYLWHDSEWKPTNMILAFFALSVRNFFRFEIRAKNCSFFLFLV